MIFNIFKKDPVPIIGVDPSVHKALQQSRDDLYIEVLRLRAVKQVRIDIIDPAIGDPVPKEENGRRAYVARYAEMHTNFLEKKLLWLIAGVREMLDMPKMSDEFPIFTSRAEYDAYLRGTSNAMKLLLDFGEQMVGENADYISRPT